MDDDDLSLQLYHDVFELEFLRETETMYHEEALRVMRDSQFTVSAEAKQRGSCGVHSKEDHVGYIAKRIMWGT